MKKIICIITLILTMASSQIYAASPSVKIAARALLGSNGITRIDVGTGDLDWPNTRNQGVYICEVNLLAYDSHSGKRHPKLILEKMTRFGRGVNNNVKISVRHLSAGQIVEVWTRYRNNCGRYAEDKQSISVTLDTNLHVYLHYDYMVNDGSINGMWEHSHAPDAFTLQYVIDTYAQHGITLHIDPQPNAIVERSVVTLDTAILNNPQCTGPDAISIDNLKALYYHKQHPVEHYMIFAHYNTCEDAEGCSKCVAPIPGSVDMPEWLTYPSSSAAKLNGYDSIISFGGLVLIGIDPIPSIYVASQMMHTLGHNFGLRHGGDDNLDNKPNYVSSMNDAYLLGIGRLSANGNYNGYWGGYYNPAVGFKIDYSSGILPTLHEGQTQTDQSDQFLGCVDDGSAGLDETAGLPGGPRDVIIFLTDNGYTTVFAAGGGFPIDWNVNQALENKVFTDIDGDQKCSVLHDFDDWSKVKAAIAGE